MEFKSSIDVHDIRKLRVYLLPNKSTLHECQRAEHSLGQKDCPLPLWRWILRNIYNDHSKRNNQNWFFLSRCIPLQDVLPSIYRSRIHMVLMTGGSSLEVRRPHRDRDALLTTYGSLNRHYPTHDLKRIPGSLDAPNIQILSLNDLSLHINM